MGHKKAGLDTHSRYQRVLFRCLAAEALTSWLRSGRTGTVELRIEGPGAEPWDDIVEWDSHGRETRWQVKDADDLDKNAIAGMLAAMLAVPGAECRLQLRSFGKVRGVGPFANLAELCRQARAGPLDTSVRGSKSDDLWLSLIGPRVDVLHRLRLRSGDDATLEERAISRLGDAFLDPLAAWNALVLVLEPVLNPRQRVTVTWLAEQLRDLAMANQLAAWNTESRREWLVAADGWSGAQEALDDLGLGQGRVPLLARVWIDRAAAGTGGGSIHALLADPGVGTVVVEGEAGSGKSALLRHLTGELAAAALVDAEAPVPLHFRAADLRGDATPCSFGPPGLRRPGRNSRQIVLIDGLDEVPVADWARVRERLRALSVAPEVVKLVVAGRPTGTRGLPPEATFFRLSPWSPGELGAFIELWSRTTGAPVSPAVPLTAFSSPLVATLCSLVQGAGGKGPTRGRVFDAVCAELFESWALRRAPGTEVRGQWPRLAKVLGRVALQMIRDGRDEMTVETLRAVLAADGAFGGVDLDAVERVFGVLVPADHGRYRFLARWVQEWLGGQALRSTEAVIEAASAGWGAEVARHAVEQRTRRSAEKGRRLCAALVEGWEGSFQRGMMVSPAHVGRVRVALLAALDLGRPPSAIGEAATAHLCEEASVWVGDYMIAAAEECGRRGGPTWKVLRPHLMQLLQDDRDMGAWARGGADHGEVWWFLRLRHRSAAVRATAMARLIQATGPNLPVNFLARMMEDNDHLFWQDPAALVAARALRERRPHADAVLDELRSRLRTRHQVDAGMAAVALGPKDADPNLLARALQLAHNAYGHLGPEVTDLAQTDEGREALDRWWPEWALRTAPVNETPLSIAGGEHPPPSPAVRRRVSRVLAAGRGVNVDVLLRAAQRGLREAQLAICERAAWDDAPLRSLLDGALPGEPVPDGGARFVEFDRSCQDALGRAALHRASLAARLVAAWVRFDAAPTFRAWYPGLALTPLVRAGHEAATGVFAAWFPHSGNQRIFGWPAISADLLHIPAVRGAARSAAANIWTAATQRSAEGTILHPGSVASVLAGTVSAWAETEVFDGLLAWLNGDDDEHRRAAWHALVTGPVCPRVRDEVWPRLPTVLQRIFEEEGPFAKHHRTEAILELQLTGALRAAGSALEAVLTVGEPADQLCAAAALGRFAPPAERRRLAELAASHFPQQLGSRYRPEEYLAHLVQAAPGPWGARLLVLAEEWPVNAMAEARWMAPYLRPKDVRALVDRLAAAGFEKFEIPWRSEGAERAARPADLFQELRFFHG